MDGSETPISAARVPDRSAPQGAFQGVVLGVKRENGTQTVDIQGAQGRIRLQAEGEFQVGDRLRVLLQPGGAIRLEKAPAPAGPVADWGRGYQMPGNLAALNDVRDFEGRLANWIASRQPGLGAGGAPAAPGSGVANALYAAPGSAGAGGLVQALGGEAGALLRLPLPELLKRALAREGGREMLLQALSTLGRDGFAALTAGLEDGGESSTSSLLALLRGMRRQQAGAEAAPGGAGTAVAAGPSFGNVAGNGAGNGAATGAAGTQAGVRASGPGEMGAFWPGIPSGGSGGQAAGGASSAAAGTASGSERSAGMPWMGRVLARQDSAGTLAFAGGAQLPASARATADPMVRYLLDLGGRTLGVQSPQQREVGEFVEFEMEAQGARMQARFLDPARSLPAGLRPGFAEQPPEMRAALQVAARSLAGFAGEPYFDDLVRDFGQLLAQTGRFALPDGAAQIPPGRLPGPREIDGLLRLFVAFPRDAAQPEQQARAWGEAVRDPKALAGLFRALQPETDTSLLRVGTPLRASAGGVPVDPNPPAPSGPGAAGLPAREEALASLLRRLLPDTFKPADLLELARGAAPDAPVEGKEGKAAQFALQAFSGLVPREEEMREGRPQTFYFYQDQAWKGLQITWERDSRQEFRRRRDSGGPLKVRVETDARHMGKVDVALTLKGDEAYLHFRNQFHDVREILDAQMPELRKSAALLGVHIEDWTYAPLEDQPQAPPTAGWVRPASLDAGLLDLMG